MKRINAILLGVWCMAISAMAQENGETRSIEINGSAELEITPDEIYVVGTLREEKADEFEKVEKAFFKSLQKLNLPDENITLADMSGEYASAWFRKNQLVKEKTYQVKLNSAKMLGQFLQVADESGLKNVQIVRTDISNREEVEKDLRIKAVKDGKEKATYMTGAIDCHLGKVQQIRENYISVYRGNERVNDLMMVQSAMSTKTKMEEEPVIGFKKIRMEMKVMVRFEIID